MSTDLNGIGLRLREIRKINNITQPVMAAAIDVSDRAYKYYEQEKRELPTLAAVNISEAFSINLEWLLTGRGKVRKSDDPQLAELCAVAVLTQAEARKANLPIAKLGKIIGFVAAQASQTDETPAEVAKNYFDTL
ncbi:MULTISPECIES: helix-turn-helix domain-containing protein [Roseobacteraceae]|uniref:Helix-turn-helix domain protein n=1 Tax=Pseudosulfitobacter pseudonitzschiae TaxID=1402135 RepID=A0A221K1S4_9RHOB|nr:MULTISPECIES: helix-turn-helix transcriptional regulator [Roseobacteraceae]ASM72921.1 helix-turn-helix domain protein [Pseudosulfitobacter pseudonitzschiae]